MMMNSKRAAIMAGAAYGLLLLAPAAALAQTPYQAVCQVLVDRPEQPSELKVAVDRCVTLLQPLVVAAEQGKVATSPAGAEESFTLLYLVIGVFALFGLAGYVYINMPPLADQT